ncbi:MAG: AcfC family putative adhesin [Chitinophagaceae bacterium]
MRKYMLLLIASIGSLSAYAQNDTLHVYGPGGPLSAMKDCAEAFSQKTGIPVEVIGGPEPKWLAQAQQNADIIYGGAEYMLTQFIQAHPGMVDVSTRVELYKRRAAILVRPGNPKRIATLKDLTKPGIHVLDVNGAGQFGLWEDIAGKEDLIGVIQRNIAGSFANTTLGIEAWKKDSSYDVWITYVSWHQNLKDITQVVELPMSLRLCRGTPVALTENSKHSHQAKEFLQFLQSAAGHTIFKKWGWD